MDILVLIYSSYGHTFRMAKAVAEGAREVEGANVVIKRVPETLSEDTQEMMGMAGARPEYDRLPEADPNELSDYDAIIFGVPTRFGNMAAQMRQFLDATGGLWQKGSLVGKVGSVFTSTATQHGGQESTILSFHTTLLHQGMVLVGLPYEFEGQSRMDEITGGSPYGAATIAGGSGERWPSENELEAARFQGHHVAEITRRLFRDLEEGEIAQEEESSRELTTH